MLGLSKHKFLITDRNEFNQLNTYSFLANIFALCILISGAERRLLFAGPECEMNALSQPEIKYVYK